MCYLIILGPIEFSSNPSVTISGRPTFPKRHHWQLKYFVSLCFWSILFFIVVIFRSIRNLADSLRDCRSCCWVLCGHGRCIGGKMEVIVTKQEAKRGKGSSGVRRIIDSPQYIGHYIIPCTLTYSHSTQAVKKSTIYALDLSIGTRTSNCIQYMLKLASFCKLVKVSARECFSSVDNYSNKISKLIYNTLKCLIVSIELQFFTGLTLTIFVKKSMITSRLLFSRRVLTKCPKWSVQSLGTCQLGVILILLCQNCLRHMRILNKTLCVSV